jgi:hypothetical protein
MARGRIPEFESYDPSHAVVSSAVMTGVFHGHLGPLAWSEPAQPGCRRSWQKRGTGSDDCADAGWVLAVLWFDQERTDGNHTTIVILLVAPRQSAVDGILLIRRL